MNPKTLLVPMVVFTALMSVPGAFAKAQTPRTSGVYLTAADYENGRLAFEGDCGSKTYKLNLHDFRNEPYIDVKSGSEKHRYAKSDIFGVRACDGHDYRFASNLCYQVLEPKDIYIYAHDVWVPQNMGRVNRAVRGYYFSVGYNGQIQALTLENLKHAFPENHRFVDILDAAFGGGQNLAEFDEAHRTFKVNRLLVASREGS